MPHTGSFNAAPAGLAGYIHTAIMLRNMGLVEAPHPHDDAEANLNSQCHRWPGFRINLHDTNLAISGEVGAGWKRIGKRVGTCVACIIDDPFCPKPMRAQPIEANQRGALCPLYWNRSLGREEKD